MINYKRVKSDIVEIAKISENNGDGITRTAYSKEDKLTKEYLIKEVKKLGLEVFEDSIGTLFARKNGKEKNLPSVMFGSHYDSVFNGGRFDGVVGVVTALEVLRTLVEEGYENYYPLDLIMMNAEEGETFGPSTGVTNSRAIVGTLTEEELDSVKNRHGQTKREAMIEYGLDPNLEECKWEKGSIKDFVEVHIEQGPVLENTNKTIGIVGYLPGIGRYKIKFKGEKSDSTAKMSERKDALLAASYFTVKFNEYMSDLGEDITGSVNQMNISPNSNQFVADEVECRIEIRTFSTQLLENLDIREKINSLLNETKNKFKVDYKLEDMRRINYPNPTPPSVMDEDNTKLIEKICKDKEIDYMFLNNGTGHDSMIMTDFTKTNMIYVPSRDGVSHSPEEHTNFEDIYKCTDVLYEFIKELSKK